jgi:hypothetical protein
MTELTKDARIEAVEMYNKWRGVLASADQSDLETLVMLMMQARRVDGIDGRKWDAQSHRFFSESIESTLDSIITKALNEPY